LLLQARINECEAAQDILETAQGTSTCIWEETVKALNLVSNHWGSISCVVKAQLAQFNFAFKMESFAKSDSDVWEEILKSMMTTLMPLDSMGMGFSSFDGANPAIHTAIQELVESINATFDEECLDANADPTDDELPFRRKAQERAGFLSVTFCCSLILDIPGNS
jgi:hypothetical protein